ncbi:acyl-CoA synthetase [Acrocarpospora pleiomorpha]|uniref:Acyl-CoA synthetase n=1 Tax=Acrocarpospora pleiomorpha TaxID=90975 RepID=A0A5M3XKE9_9ACTN|nr:acetate--CoA ligase family protein [Acrocarpospora pleiomorpha]GES18588.1 acyl-CoA synthetase [Acrocarpospora pleiomorpha]
MKPARLLAPRSVAVVGASTRPGSYGNQAVANLVSAGFPGPIFGVHPTADEVHGVPCVPRISDLPLAPDALVIATPAASVPALVAEAGAYGCGGAVVLAAGFAEIAEGRPLQDELARQARLHRLPICGPNGNGIVSVVNRAPLWGDAYTARRPGPVALISQSGNVAVNALLSTRALGLHTVVSCGNQAVLDAADYLTALARLDGVRSVALYLEDEGDGHRLATALADCADHDIRIAVLKAGASPLGASAAAAHTGSIAGDSRVLRALIEEAGGAWAHNPHELLELAKTLATPRRPHVSPTTPVDATTATNVGVLVVTCSGGDAATAADEAERLGVWLPQLGAATVEALGEVLPTTATAGNPLDYTAVIFGETERTADLITVGARDDAIGPVLVYYDRPARMSEDAAESWDGALDGVILAASRLDQPVIVASTLPELMPEETAERLAAHGIVAVAGLSEGILCAGALTVPPPDATRLRSIAAIMSGPKPSAESPSVVSGWVAEHEAKEMLVGRGLAVPRGRVVRDVDDALRVAGELGGPVALKASSPFIQHKSDISALVLGVEGDAVREAYTRVDGLGGVVLVEEMVAPGVEVLIAVRRDGVVPVLVVALGGVWVEIFDDVVLIPLPADADRVEQAVRRLRAAPLLVGGRGRPPGDIRALAETAATVGAMALDEGLDLVELNPVFVRPDGVTVVDAVIRRGT